MPSTNNIKLSVGVEATGASAGVAVKRTAVVPISGLIGVDRKPNTGEDPAIIGNNITSGEYILFADVGGDIPLAIRPTGGFAMLVKSVLGEEGATPDQVGAMMRFRHTGVTGDSCKVTVTGDIISSYIGSKGAETADLNFGATGDIDLSITGSYGTLGKLVTAINGYGSYNAEKVFGADAFVTETSIIAFAANAQGRNTWVHLWFGSNSSGAYRHVFTAHLEDQERPTLTLQKDGYHDNFQYPGCVVDVLNINGALKAMCEGSATVLGFTEATATEDTTLTLEDYKPLIFYQGDFTIGAHEYDYIRNFDFSIGNNSNPDGYGGGSVDRLYHQKGKLDITGSMQVRLDSDSFAERAKVFADTAAAVAFSLKGGFVSGVVPEMMLIEMPYCSLTNFENPENAGVLDADISYRATKPKGTVYNEPITVTVINDDASAYNKLLNKGGVNGLGKTSPRKTKKE